MRFPVILSAVVLLTTSLEAQTTKEGYTLSWNNKLTVVPDSLGNGKFKLPAYTITLFECDASQAMDIWKTDFKTKSADLGGSKPGKASGVVLATVSELPIMVMALSSSERKSGEARLTLAFAKNDSTGVDQPTAAAAMAQELAVTYNKAVVAEQISTKEKTLLKADSKLEGAKSDASKLDQKAIKANAELKKIKSKEGKVQSDIAKYSGEIAGMESKFSMTNDPKDLQKLTKLRVKRAKAESQLAKMMQNETRTLSKLHDYEGDKPDAAKEAQMRTETKEQVQQEIDALKRKMDNIR